MFSRGTRVSLDIKAGNPVILVPRSAKSCHMLVADLGNLTVANGFVWEGSSSTLAYTNNRQKAHSQNDLGKSWVVVPVFHQKLNLRRAILLLLF